ncbi:MAG: hypothetical protein WDN28_33465 [Chthoniobacter sp.]
MATDSHPFRMIRRARQSGVALVVTLITLSILVVLLVGFVASMSLERRAAHSFEDTQRAKLIAQGAVSHAVDLLRTNIPDPAQLSETPASAPAENWAVNPGRLTVVNAANPASPAVKYIPLHTGEVTSPPANGQPLDTESVDLNAPLPGDTVPVITGTAAGTGKNAPPMRVKWANLVSDPTTAPSQTNPLVGRYAFWIDDECGRVNFNTALGKPVPTAGTKFGDQLNGSPPTPAVVTPLFDRGDSTVSSSGTTRSWALGRPQSINLDSFFDSPDQLLADKLLSYTFLHGFARYPEAILDFVNVPNARTWYDANRFNLTFFSRSPEFNTFGLSRFFTTFIPLSLEGGPSYQHPFIYDPSGAYAGVPEDPSNTSSPEILHLNSFLGYFGFTDAVTNDDTGTTVLGGNAVNKMQEEMLFSYLRRAWPEYGTNTFLAKYQEAECRQIALNILLMSRMATVPISTDLASFSKEWSIRSTSVNFAPLNTDLAGHTPERFYWRFTIGGKTVLMLPQMPGPHITEVRLFATSVSASKVKSKIAEDATAPPLNDPTGKIKNFTNPVYIQYYYQVEYYMEPGGPVLDISEFPIRMDYLELTAQGAQANEASLNVNQVFGATSPTDTTKGATWNWNAANSLARLVTLPNPGTTIGPAGSSYQGTSVPNRVVVNSPVFTVGSDKTVPLITGSDYTTWTPQPFEAVKSTSVSLNIKFRPGMGVLNAPGRPRQMIPLGETSADTLQATFTVSIQPTNKEQVISWQINDPRLSWDLKQWTANVQGPSETGKVNVGTPGEINTNEPAETSSERSKFRYIERAPAGARMGSYALDRDDEYESAGRTSSPGYWSMIHTGMQRSLPWQTIDFSPASAQDKLPDWLLLDLFGPTYPMVHDQWKIDATLPDQFSTPSYMNSTAGQVNLNSRIYPQNDFFRPPARTLPLTAVFKNLRSDSEVTSLVNNIVNYQNDTTVFNYVGELANVPGYAGAGTTTWEKESLLRNMAGCLTTRSQTFGVWGVAQTVKKLSKNTNYGAFESGDSVLAEKRFYALVERYVWPGRDGVPGNAHLDGAGKWDRLAQQAGDIAAAPGTTDTLFQLPGSPPLSFAAGQPRLQLYTKGSYPAFDGPQQVGMDPYAAAALGKVAWNKSTLEDAYNPPQAAIKYRVVYFKYLDQ